MPAEAWALVEGLAPAYGDDWWYVSMLAFVRQEQERWSEAERLSEWALSREPGSGHAVHARTHVLYETGDHEAGLDFLDGWIAGCGRSSSHRAHFSWPAALHELALGDDEAVRRRYREQLAPDQVQGVRALVDSASILWRCALTRRWDGAVPVADVLAVIDNDLLDRPTTPFTAMHAAVAVAAAGDEHRLRRLSAYAQTADHPVLSATIAPLADSLALLVSGRSDAATEALIALAGVERIGGSAAQREVVEDTILAASLAAGRTDITRAILDRRLDRRPSPADRALLRALPKQT